jgi:hypothetical protein
VELSRPGLVIASACNDPEHLALNDQSGVADLRHFAFAAPAITKASSSNFVATANQKSRQSRQRPRKAGGRINTNITDEMRSGPEQRPRGRFNANRPFKQQPQGPQNNLAFDSNGPNIKIRGSAYQIFERYVALAREATASRDRVENFYQHAEHYFRVNNARREGNQQGMPSRPTTPADVEMNPTEADAREVDRFDPNGTVTIPFPGKVQLTKTNRSQPSKRATAAKEVGRRPLRQCQHALDGALGTASASVRRRREAVDTDLAELELGAGRETGTYHGLKRPER